jgi:hypothetical protein
MADVSNNSSEEIPSEFKTLMNDFMGDILTSFPELASSIQPYSTLDNEETLSYLFEHCKKVYPARFFDILYNNDEIFTDETIHVEFLPNIDFSNLWKETLTQKTRDIIWKYLQLILFCVIQNVKDASYFGNSEKLFEAIDEDEFKKKIEESMDDIGKFFEDNGSIFGTTDNSGNEDFNIPNSDEIHSHISGLLKGKLGRLASDIAEETANEMDFDLSGSENVNDVFSTLFKNPTKLMKMVKSIGAKIDNKIKSGQLDEKELMQEASELMKQMKNMPGMKNMDKMFKSMNIPTNGKVNLGAMQQKLSEMTRQTNTKDRMLKKLQKNKEEAKQAKQAQNKKPEKSHKEIQKEIDALFKTFQTEGYTTQKKSNTANKKKKKRKKKGNLQQK